jgi:hypothetical protein
MSVAKMRRSSGMKATCAADCDPARIRTLIWGGAPMYVEDA